MTRKNMKIYDLVKNILENSEQTRNSDKLLIWEVYKKIGIVKDVEWFGDREAIIRDNFLSARIPATETITRARRKIQELHPELQATNSTVKSRRGQKQLSKGTFIFRETFG